jgi:hypothetical protein
VVSGRGADVFVAGAGALVEVPRHHANNRDANNREANNREANDREANDREPKLGDRVGRSPGGTASRSASPAGALVGQRT